MAIILVAFEVEDTDNMKEAQETLIRMFVKHATFDDVSWWIAEDERYDGSDASSAVFCKKGSQVAATNLLSDVTNLLRHVDLQ